MEHTPPFLSHTGAGRDLRISELLFSGKEDGIIQSIELKAGEYETQLSDSSRQNKGHI